MPETGNVEKTNYSEISILDEIETYIVKINLGITYANKDHSGKFQSEEERKDILQKTYKNVQKALFQSKMERKKKAGIDNGDGSI